MTPHEQSPAHRRLPAGEYWFEDLSVGDAYETGGIVVTEAHIMAFAGLSGDFFPVHMDDAFARAQGFPGRIAHGLLGLALIDGLKNRSPVQLLAVASLGWTWKFTAPILPGDRVYAQISVKAKRLSSGGKGLVVLEISAFNQRQVCVQRGETTLLCRRQTPST